MKASAKNLLSIIKEPKQFIIPIYQRTYSWQFKQCALLLKDIQAASKSEQGHFIGSIVYFQPDINTIAEINKYNRWSATIDYHYIIDCSFSKVH